MSKAGYEANTQVSIALSAGVGLSVFGLKSATDWGIDLRQVWVEFDGVTAGNTPVLVELCYCTYATASATPVTIQQIYGRTQTAGNALAVRGFTPEPTVLTVVKEWLVTPNGGRMLEAFADNKGFDTALLEGFVIRCTAPQVVNVRAGAIFERA